MGVIISCFHIKHRSGRIVPVPEPSNLNSSDSIEDIESSFQNISVMEKVEVGGSQTSLTESLQESRHFFKKKTFHKPTYCHHCSDMLWGLTNQGMQCTVCGYVTHEKCQVYIVKPCNTKAADVMQVPQTHHLIQMNDRKKRFCNVCRKRIEESHYFSCQVCCYFIHNLCKKKIRHNCKIAASYTRKTEKLKVKQFHHWCEGHLPYNSKCSVCMKGCASTDGVAGLRCSWCLTTIHSYCIGQFNTECNYGSLHNLVLPPYAIKQLNPNTVKSSITNTAEAAPVYHANGTTNRKQSKSDEHIVRIYEGPFDNPSGWRNVVIKENSITADILSIALQKFHVQEDKTKYYLTRVRNTNTEVTLENHEKPWQYVQDVGATTPFFFLRHVKLDNKELKLVLHAGAINTSIPNVTFNVSLTQPASAIIVRGLALFKLENEDPDDYCLTQMRVTEQRVRETSLHKDESIYAVLVEKRKQTITAIHSTRFYLQPKEEQATCLSLYVEQLPTGLDKKQYQYILADVTGPWEDGMEIVAVFPNQGAIVIQLATTQLLLKIVTALNINTLNIQSLNTVGTENKRLKLHILPEIKANLIPKETSPVIVFVNSKSGGGQGIKLLQSFKRLLNPYQVVDLLDGGPLPILYMFRNVSKFRILICGGDGTFAWVLSCLEDIRYNILKCTSPGSALVPLGTGNDLARALHWGSGYSGESPLSLLNTVSYAGEVMMDRWNVVFDELMASKSQGCLHPPPPFIISMNNYFGVGIDAELCLQFHLSREENPEKFDSRLYNKGVYFRAGLKSMTSKGMANLQDRLSLQVDGELITLPSIEGLAILNIASWGAGADPWGNDRDEKFSPQQYDDGLLEIIGFTGVYHMGKIKSGLSTAIRITQGTQINLKLKEDLPVQVDGEPWVQPCCDIMVRPTLQQAKMLVKSVIRSKTPPTERKLHPDDALRRHTFDVVHKRTSWYK